VRTDASLSVNHKGAEGNDENHHRDFDQHDKRICSGAFADAVDEKNRDRRYY